MPSRNTLCKDISGALKFTLNSETLSVASRTPPRKRLSGMLMPAAVTEGHSWARSPAQFSDVWRARAWALVRCCHVPDATVCVRLGGGNRYLRTDVSLRGRSQGCSGSPDDWAATAAQPTRTGQGLRCWPSSAPQRLLLQESPRSCFTQTGGGGRGGSSGKPGLF